MTDQGSGESPTKLGVEDAILSLDVLDSEKEEALRAVKEPSATPPAEVEAETPVTEKESSDLRIKLSQLGVGGKIKAALLGNAATRAILIRDTNKIVQLCVLKNPRINPAEVEDFAGNPNLSDQVLRTIGNSPGWMRAPKTKARLVSNPKTPLDMAMRWMRYLQANDLKTISRSKNIPSAIVTMAKKMLSDEK